MPSILVVEDDAPHRRTLELGLSARGFEVTAVSDGRAARNAVDSTHHDVVLLDLGLPDIDGIELAQQFTILTILLRNPKKLVTHEVLARANGYGDPSDRNALHVAVSRLRRRLGDGPDRPEIVTEKPVGSRLRVPASGAGS